jgi:acyl-CoA thioester hydrolase
MATPLDSTAQLGDFPHVSEIGTRWDDHDVYGHVNNVQYYAFFDTVINAYLIEDGGLNIHDGEEIGLCAESSCRFYAPIVFPEPVTAALRVGHLGSQSVRYELGLFTPGPDGQVLAATGWFVHVFVRRDSRRPHPIPAPLRSSLERLLVDGAADPD